VDCIEPSVLVMVTSFYVRLQTYIHTYIYAYMHRYIHTCDEGACLFAMTSTCRAPVLEI
jgi:hypothetical protein